MHEPMTQQRLIRERSDGGNGHKEDAMSMQKTEVSKKGEEFQGQ